MPNPTRQLTLSFFSVFVRAVRDDGVHPAAIWHRKVHRAILNEGGE